VWFKHGNLFPICEQWAEVISSISHLFSQLVSCVFCYCEVYFRSMHISTWRLYEVWTYLLMQLSPSWGANNWAATQELPSISWNPKVQYSIYKRPPLVPVLFILGIRPGPRPLLNVRNKLIFYGELLAPRQTPKLEYHPLLAVRDCLFNTFAAVLHNWRASLRSANMKYGTARKCGRRFQWKFHDEELPTHNSQFGEYS
jgi:hypothetical protein